MRHLHLLLQMQYWLLVFVMLMNISSRSTEASTFRFPIQHINITNDLRSDLDLTVHCKSKNDDLGVKVIHFNGSWEFQFRPLFFGGTLFYCSFEWKYTLKYFDIYVQIRDHKKCSICLWKIRPRGPCMFNYESKAFDYCYAWNKAISSIIL